MDHPKSGQRRPIVPRASRLHSWVVFAYEPFPNRLRPSDLSLGRLSSGQRRPIVPRASRLHSWVVFAYEPFPNQLRPSGLPLGRLSKKNPRICGGSFISAPKRTLFPCLRRSTRDEPSPCGRDRCRPSGSCGRQHREACRRRSSRTCSCRRLPSPSRPNRRRRRSD